MQLFSPATDLRLIDLGVGRTQQPFRACWQQQRQLHQQRVVGEIPDTVLLTEHESVYTAGKRTSPSEISQVASEIVQVDRGGRITWHGPGQIVGYPILQLRQPLDVVAYVRTLEQLLIDTCAQLGLAAHRVTGRSGVWVDPQHPRKLAAIGVRVAQGVSLHGFALNVNCDLSAYDSIVPCGISDAGVTSLAQELQNGVDLQTVLPVLRTQLLKHLTPVNNERSNLCKQAAAAPPADKPGKDQSEKDGPLIEKSLVDSLPATSANPDVSTTSRPGKRLLRLEVRNSAHPIEEKPDWIKNQAVQGPNYHDLQQLVSTHGLHTVCQEAACPNIFQCWQDREATFLIGGSACSRRCDFCQIDTGKPQPLDLGEPARVAASVEKMGLRYATVTGVARDDLPDEGALLYAQTVRAIHQQCPGTGVEVLIPDFSAKPQLLGQVFEAAPQVLAHNLETVERIFRRIRPGFTYSRSLDVITQAKAAGMITKSNLILGLGETDAEIDAAMQDLRNAGCDLLTITQYLRPTPRHHPVDRWVKPQQFVTWQQRATQLGFAGVLSGPLVRSSYRAGRLYQQAVQAGLDTFAAAGT